MIERKVIRDFLTTLAAKNIRLRDDDSLLAAKALNSLMVAELVVFLESHYQVTFDSDELTAENLDTINSIASLLERKGATDSQP
jgi:acyl carrier protein